MDVDGFNIAYAVTATTYKPGTLREKLFGAGDYLPANHPAHRYRDIEAVKREEATLIAPAPKGAVA